MTFRAFCDLGWTWVEVHAPTEAVLNEKVEWVFATMKAPQERQAGMEDAMSDITITISADPLIASRISSRIDTALRDVTDFQRSETSTLNGERRVVLTYRTREINE